MTVVATSTDVEVNNRLSRKFILDFRIIYILAPRKRKTAVIYHFLSIVYWLLVPCSIQLHVSVELYVGSVRLLSWSPLT